MTEAATAPAALTERRGNVLIITEARNAVNCAVSTAVGDALQEAQDDPEVRAVVITGAGESFCAGADLKAMSSGDALKWGLINQVVPDGTAVDAALALAERITVNAPLAVWASKRVASGVDDGVIVGDEPGWTRTMREIGTLIRSEDAKEGPLAFAEKREPVWKAK